MDPKGLKGLIPKREKARSAPKALTSRSTAMAITKGYENFQRSSKAPSPESMKKIEEKKEKDRDKQQRRKNKRDPNWF